MVRYSHLSILCSLLSILPLVSLLLFPCARPLTSMPKIGTIYVSLCVTGRGLEWTLWGILFIRLVYSEAYHRGLLQEWQESHLQRFLSWRRGKRLRASLWKRFVVHWGLTLIPFTMYRFLIMFGCMQSSRESAPTGNRKNVRFAGKRLRTFSCWRLRQQEGYINGNTCYV